YYCFFFQAEDGIRDRNVTGVQTCALPILSVKSFSECSRLTSLTSILGIESCTNRISSKSEIEASVCAIAISTCSFFLCSLFKSLIIYSYLKNFNFVSFQTASLISYHETKTIFLF